MTEYKCYRNGTGPIEKRIRDAVTHFYKSQGKRLPAGLVVHQSVLASEVEAARAAVKALELNLPVKGGGGPLRNEIWLEVRNSDKQPVLQQASFDVE